MAVGTNDKNDNKLKNNTINPKIKILTNKNIIKVHKRHLTIKITSEKWGVIRSVTPCLVQKAVTARESRDDFGFCVSFKSNMEASYHCDIVPFKLF